jgi:hypothetical protein
VPKDDVRKEQLKIHRGEPSPETGLQLEDRVYLIVTRAFCPAGHNLVRSGGTLFDGYAGISLRVSDGVRKGIVELSPFHGDPTKAGITFAPGKKLSVCCPECGIDLPTLARCTCPGGGELRKIFLTPAAVDAHLIAICDVWGCPRSRTIDSYEIMSEFLEGNIEE